MAFADLLADPQRCPVALEITPPQKPAAKVLLRRAGLLGPLAAAINVIQRPGRVPSLDASLDLSAAGYEPAWHLVTRGRERATIEADLARAAAAGMGIVLCIRGDDQAPDAPGTPSIREVVGLARERLSGALIGATFNQYGAAQDAALRNLAGKVAAGASYVQTQPVFDAAAFVPVANRLRERWPALRLIPMVMPLIDATQAERIAARLHIAPPPVPADPAAAWAAFTATVASLRESGLVDALAVMTFEMDPEPRTGEQIARALKDGGAG